MSDDRRFQNYMHGYLAGLGLDAEDRAAAFWSAQWAAGFRAGRLARTRMERDSPARPDGWTARLLSAPDLPV